MAKTLRKLLAAALSISLAVAPVSAAPSLNPSSPAPLSMDAPPVNPGAETPRLQEPSLSFGALLDNQLIIGPETLGRLPADGLARALQPHMEAVAPLASGSGLLVAQALARSAHEGLGQGAITDSFLAGELLARALSRPALLDHIRDRLRPEAAADPAVAAALGGLDRWAELIKDETRRERLAASLRAVELAAEHVRAGTDPAALARIFDGGSLDGSSAADLVRAGDAPPPSRPRLARPGAEPKPVPSALEDFKRRGYAVIEAGSAFSRWTLAAVALIAAAIQPAPDARFSSSRSLFVHGKGWVVPDGLHEELTAPVRGDVEKLTERMRGLLPGEDFHLVSAEIRRLNAGQERDAGVHIDGQYITLTLALGEEEDQGTTLYPIAPDGAISTLRTPTGAAVLISNDERPDGIVHGVPSGKGARSMLLVRWSSGKLPTNEMKARVEARELAVRAYLRRLGKTSPPLSAVGRRSAGLPPAPPARLAGALKGLLWGLGLGAAAGLHLGSWLAFSATLAYFVLWGALFTPIAKTPPQVPPRPDAIAVARGMPSDLLILSPMYNEGTKKDGRSPIEATLRRIADQPGGAETLSRIVFVNDGSTDDTRAIVERLKAELRERFGRDVVQLVSYPPGQNQHKEGAFFTTLAYLKRHGYELPPVIGLMDSDSHLVSEVRGETVLARLQDNTRALLSGGFDAMPIPIVGHLNPRSGLLERLQAADWANMRTIQWGLGQLSRWRPLRMLGLRAHTTGIAALYDTRKLEAALERHSLRNFKGGDYELDAKLPNTSGPARGLAAETELMATLSEAVSQGTRSWEGAIASVPLVFAGVLLLLTAFLGILAMTALPIALGLVSAGGWLAPASLVAAGLLGPGLVAWLALGGRTSVGILDRAAFLPWSAAYVLGLNAVTAYLALFRAVRNRVRGP